MLLLLALAAALAVHMQNRLPQVLPEDAPPSEFSAARALKHLRIVGARPHPIGSQEHATVRDYILRELSDLGLEAATQRTSAVNGRRGTPFSAGTVENVVARLKGTQGGRAILLACHYDSVVNGAGASDDGAGVVTLLETARAIKAGPPLKNDLILLFTDGEEVGLLGANAFASEHPWAKEVGVFLNFEARGNSGPVVMFETTRGNGGMIRQSASAAPRPLANSFFYEIYQRLPNDTDFTVLKGLGAQGMNFAFVNGINHYHTQLDTVAEINPGSLQQEGSHALALARHFGDSGTDDAKTANAVYFNPLGTIFIDYPGALVIPLLVLTALLFGFAVFKGFKAREVSARGVANGFVGSLAGVVAAGALVWLAWWLVRAAQPAYRRVPWGEPYHSNAFRVGLVLLAVAATSSIYVIFRQRAGERGLLTGALIWWLILSGLASVAMPGGSYLFTLPLLFSALGLALVFVLKIRGQTNRRILLALAALPGVVLWAPMIYNLFVALTLNGSWPVSIFVSLLCGLLVPVLIPVLASRRWLLPGLLALSAVCFIVVGGVLNSGFDERRPAMDHVFYALDADNGEAVYASSDEGVDAWTAQFFNGGAKRGTMPEYFPGNPRTFMEATATAVKLAGPEAVVTDDMTENGVRTLAFHVRSARGAGVVSVYAEPDAEVLNSSVNGKPTTGDGPAPPAPVKYWGIQYYAPPPEGFDVVLRTKKTGPFKLFVVDRSYGLPEVPGSLFKPRPEGLMPAPVSTSDATLVSKSFTL